MRISCLCTLALSAALVSAPPGAHAAPQAATPVAFGDRGELIVDGKRRFIRAGYRSGQVDGFVEGLPTAAKAGFDMVHDYRFETFDVAKLGVQKYIEEARAYLRRAEKLNLGVFLGLPRESVRTGDEVVLAKIVAALSKERALWMWYIYDEPRPEVLSIESAARVYGLLRRMDPGRPSIMLTNRTEAVQQYSRYCDVLWFDRYPLAATREVPSLSPVAEALETARKTVPAGKPVWPVLQAHDNKGNPSLRERAPTLRPPDDKTHRPTESELRAQAHIAIARKAMAVAYYWAPESWYSMKTDTPQTWASLTRVLQELGSLEAVLLSGEATHPVEVSGGSDEVLMWTRVHDGQTYVGLVNADTRKPARLLLQTPQAGQGFRKVLGDGVVESTNRGLGIRLDPAGVAVISIDTQ